MAVNLILGLILALESVLLILPKIINNFLLKVAIEFHNSLIIDKSGVHLVNTDSDIGRVLRLGVLGFGLEVVELLLWLLLLLALIVQCWALPGFFPI